MSKFITRTLSLLTLSTAFCATNLAQAVIVERLPQGWHNINRPTVNEELAAYTRHIDMTAPRADTSPKHRVYTYDNNTSEYLRDNLNLPKMQSNYAMQSASYLKTPNQSQEHNSTVESVMRDSQQTKSVLKNHAEKVKNSVTGWDKELDRHEREMLK